MPKETSKQDPKPKFQVKVKKSSAGLGLFAEELIPREEEIIEYIGPILNNDEADEKAGQYLFRISNRRTIDGSVRYNTARYINHSCRPNCEAIDVRGRIYIYSKRKINPGEELTYDYGKEFWDEYIKPYGCKCNKCLEKK